MTVVNIMTVVMWDVMVCSSVGKCLSCTVSRCRRPEFFYSWEEWPWWTKIGMEL